ncbi:ATP-binding protein, partial [Burkholderia contaminans]
MEDDFLIERLLYSSEGDALDFKLQQYPFENADDDSKSSLLKDILAFANAWRTTTAYIVIGVRDGSKEVVGLDNDIDDSRLQQFVNAKVNRPIQFGYRS